MWFVYASFYPSDQLSLRNRSIVWWLGRRFCASSEMVAHQSPMYLIFWCAMVLASLDLFCNSKLYEWLNELAAVLICNLSVLFLYGCPSAKLLSTSAEICSPSASFGTTSTLSVDFAASFFFDDLFCAWDCSQLSRFYCLLFCVVPGGFPRLSVVVSAPFLGRQLFLLKFFFSEPFQIRLWGWWSLWGTRTELCRSTRQSRSQAHAQGFPWLSMWHSVLQVFLSLLTSHCFDFLSEWPNLLLQSDDNFELLPCTHWTKSISQGSWCLALSH